MTAGQHVPKACEVNIVKKADDPLDIGRVSMGGPIPIDEGVDGFYLTYRGTTERAIMILQAGLVALQLQRHMLGGVEPVVTPENEGQAIA